MTQLKNPNKRKLEIRLRGDKTPEEQHRQLQSNSRHHYIIYIPELKIVHPYIIATQSDLIDIRTQIDDLIGDTSTTIAND